MSLVGQSRRMPLRTGVGPLPLFPETGRESEGFDSDALCQQETNGSAAIWLVRQPSNLAFSVWRRECCRLLEVDECP
jgi:hypothetical protein